MIPPIGREVKPRELGPTPFEPPARVVKLSYSRGWIRKLNSHGARIEHNKRGTRLRGDHAQTSCSYKE